MFPKFDTPGVAALAIVLASAPAARAHVTLSQTQAPGGGYFTAYLRVGHGCEGTATTALRVEAPAELLAMRPQPKPGWMLRIEHEPLPAAVKGEGGRTLTERVSSVTWSGGPLPDEEWDEFGLSLKLPARVGPLYLPVVQTCGRRQVRWADTPPPGAPDAPLAHPAPRILLTPPGADSMAGMKMGG